MKLSGWVFGVLFLSFSAQAGSELLNSGAAPLTLKNEAESDAFAREILSRARALDEGERLELHFVHVEGQEGLHPLFKRALVIARQELYGSSEEEKLRIFVDQVSHEDQKQAVLDLEKTLPGELEYDSIVRNYEEQAGKLPSSFRKKLLKWTGAGWVFNRVKSFFGTVTGLPHGLTFLRHIFIQKKGEKSLRFGRSERSLKTALIGGFTAFLSVTIATTDLFARYIHPDWNWGLTELFSQTHFMTAGIIGSWVFTALYFYKNLISFKLQGRIVHVDSKNQKVSVDTNLRTLWGLTIAQEHVFAVLATAALGGNPIDPQTLGTVIVPNATLSALSYLGFETWIQKALFIPAEAVKAKLAVARAAGDLAQVEELEKEVKKYNVKISVALFTFWNVIYPIAKWSGFIAAFGQTGWKAWVLGNSVLLAMSAGSLYPFVKQWIRDHIENRKDKKASPCELLYYKAVSVH